MTILEVNEISTDIERDATNRYRRRCTWRVFSDNEYEDAYRVLAAPVAADPNSSTIEDPRTAFYTWGNQTFDDAGFWVNSMNARLENPLPQPNAHRFIWIVEATFVDWGVHMMEAMHRADTGRQIPQYEDRSKNCPNKAGKVGDPWDRAIEVRWGGSYLYGQDEARNKMGQKVPTDEEEEQPQGQVGVSNILEEDRETADEAIENGAQQPVTVIKPSSKETIIVSWIYNYYEPRFRRLAFDAINAEAMWGFEKYQLRLHRWDIKPIRVTAADNRKVDGRYVARKDEVTVLWHELEFAVNSSPDGWFHRNPNWISQLFKGSDKQTPEERYPQIIAPGTYAPVPIVLPAVGGTANGEFRSTSDDKVEIDTKEIYGLFDFKQLMACGEFDIKLPDSLPLPTISPPKWGSGS